MSAFMCSNEHILALAVACTRAGMQNKPISVRHDGEWYKIQPGYVAGSDLVQRKDHLNVPVNYLAELLRLENSLSVSHRYCEVPKEFTPFTAEECAAAEGVPLLTPHTPPTAENIGALIKSAHCYQYQACEDPGWEDSFAKAATDALIDYLVQRLPGYEEAPWGPPVLGKRDAGSLLCSEDLVVALEIARCALEADPFRTLGDHLDMTDEDMAGLRERIERAMNEVCAQWPAFTKAQDREGN